MDFKFSKEPGDSQQQDAPGEKKKQSTLLVLLLILVGGFAYIYFFTDLIKPQAIQTVIETPAPAPEVVKIPLPPRDGEPAKPGVNAPEKAEAPKAAVAPPEAVAPVLKPAAAPAKPAPVKPAPTKPAPAEPAPAKPAPAAKPADKKPQTAAVAVKRTGKTTPTKAEVKKPAAEAKKAAAADKKSAPTKNVAKKAGSGSKTKQATVVKAKKTKSGTWTLLVGNYVLEEALSADMGRVRKAGFTPLINPSGRKKMTMNRLLVSEFNDRAAAQSALGELKRHTSDAFVIEQGRKFAVYAGSYMLNEAANSEKARLKAAGFKIIVKHADVAIPSQSLSVGPFNNKKAADSALGKLKGTGIKATLSQQ